MCLLVSISLSQVPLASSAVSSATVGGELKQWHKVTVSVAGPSTRETAKSPNPFLSFRMTATFHHVATKEDVVVPGYFAADGQAGESGATAGDIWRAHLCPRKTGLWRYTISLVTGNNVAVSSLGGQPAKGNGVTGAFTVGKSDKLADLRDFRGKGMILPRSGYLVHDNGQHFVKVGTDSPESMLGYVDFDGTVTNKKKLHDWSPHVQDWVDGDPVWKGGNKGKGLVGAFNYLASTGMNAVAFLTYNLGGDGDNVWPFALRSNRFVYDCSKLDQWEILFEHADKLGLFLHFKLQETENDNGNSGLDKGNVGAERKLYYREIVARFGHHLGIGWNLGEENTQTDQQRKDMVAALGNLDGYGHHIDIHTYPGQYDKVWNPLLGPGTAFTGASVQTNWNSVHGRTLTWREKSAAAGKLWIVTNDEQGSPNDGIPPDDGWPGYTRTSGVPSRADLRHQTLWGNLMAGGGGVEAYFGYKHPENDLNANNWRSRADWWKYCNHARELFETHVPFWEMEPADNLVSTGRANAYALADHGNHYLAYIPGSEQKNANVAIKIKGKSAYTVSWFNPRTGGTFKQGSITRVEGSGSAASSVLRALGTPPATPKDDWAVFLQSEDAEKPTTEKPTTTVEPTTSKVLTTTFEPTTKKGTTTFEPTTKEATTEKATTTVEPTTKELATAFPTVTTFDWVREQSAAGETRNRCCNSDTTGVLITGKYASSTACRSLCGDECWGFDYHKRRKLCRTFGSPVNGLVEASSRYCRCFKKEFDVVHVSTQPTPPPPPPQTAPPAASPTAAPTPPPSPPPQTPPPQTPPPQTPTPQTPPPQTSSPTAAPTPKTALESPTSACGVGKYPTQQKNGICPAQTHTLVPSKEACAALAAELGFEDTTPLMKHGRKKPKGCYVHGNLIYFNRKGRMNVGSTARKAICCSK